MGTNRKDLELLVRLGEENYVKRGGRVVEIGAQQLSNSFLRSNDLIKKAEGVFAAPRAYAVPDAPPSVFGEGDSELQVKEAPFARDFWMSLGFEYAAIDVDGSPGSIALDLNYDEVPKALQGKFDVVTNLGTTEHICNQLKAFKAIHDLAAVGAVMIHHLPAGGSLNHGLVNYNPKFFWYLARSNDYKWLYMDYHGGGVAYELPENILNAVRAYDPASAHVMSTRKTSDYGIQIALQKTIEIPFVPPLDVDTGVTVSNEVLERRYWTVFQPKVLDEVRRSGTAGRSISEPEILKGETADGGELSDDIRSELNRRISDASDEIRRAIDRVTGNREEAIRNALGRELGKSEEAIRNVVTLEAGVIREDMRRALRRVRRYNAWVAASSALVGALLVLGGLIAGRALHWF
jgi:hypothetical protein